jgi:putative transposase
MSQRHFVQNENTMLVTNVTLNRAPIFANPAHAREAIETLYRVQQLHPFFLYGFVFMSDHCHFLMRVPEPQTISSIMSVYKSGVRFNIGIPKLWQPRFHIRIVHDPAAAKRYIHANPIRKGFVEFPEEFPWSSACGKWDVSPLNMA